MSDTTGTRHALPSDRQTAIDALVDAFTPDPLWTHLTPSDDGTQASTQALIEVMAAEFDSLLAHGHAYVAGTHAAALWTPPGVAADDSGIGEIIARHSDPEIWADAIGNFITMHGFRPDRPHFYLALIGTAAAARGKGLGASLLERVLDTCDREGIVAHLESSNGRNVSLYERHGFDVMEEIEFAPGVIVRPMTREPRSA